MSGHHCLLFEKQNWCIQIRDSGFKMVRPECTEPALLVCCTAITNSVGRGQAVRGTIRFRTQCCLSRAWIIECWKLISIKRFVTYWQLHFRVGITGRGRVHRGRLRSSRSSNACSLCMWQWPKQHWLVASKSSQCFCPLLLSGLPMTPKLLLMIMWTWMKTSLISFGEC